MTRDVIALTERMPDAWSVLAGLLSGGPDLRVRTASDDAVIQLCDEEGRPLLSVEAPLLLRVPGEAARLLGVDEKSLGEGPLWWVEARASTAVPAAEPLAGTFAARLAHLLGGRVWPPGAPGTDTPGTPVDTSGITAVPAPAAAQPAVDVLTDRTAVVLQDRPVIAMTSWLSEVLRAAAESERGLQIVTPGHSRLSLATRTLLTAPPSRWVVQDDRIGYYDGLSGAVLRWQEGAFAPARDENGETPVAPAFGDVERTDDRQLLLSFRTRHPADDQLVLGGALETAWQALTGTLPAGWGTAEPANLPWSRRQLTALAHERAPEPTWTVVVGTPDRPAQATLRVVRTSEGVEEDVTLAVGHGPGEPVPVAGLRELADELVTRHGVRSMLCQLREARRDLSVPPRFERPPVPLAFVLGPDEVLEVGRDHAGAPPLEDTPLPLGPIARPGYYYPLGDGTTAAGWTAFERLVRHLRSSDAEKR